MQRARLLLAVLTSAAFALLVLSCGGDGDEQAQQPATETGEMPTQGTATLAVILPLTGPLSFVGKDNLAAAREAVREINANGGVEGRRLELDVLDDASNPSQGVVHAQRVVQDDEYLGVIGSGFSSVSLAMQPIFSQAGIPNISMASSVAQVMPPKPFVYMTTATSQLFAESMAEYLDEIGVTRIALMADNGGFGQEGLRNVKMLAQEQGFEIVEEIVFPLTATSFTAELNRVKNSDAEALWLWNATSLAVTITKEMRQLGLRQRLVLTGGNASPLYLDPACPQANGALLNTYLGPVAQFIREDHPSREIALKVDDLVGQSPASTFHYDGYTGVTMFAGAMELGGFEREGINTALEQEMEGFVGPGGTYRYSEDDHAGLGVDSMVVSEVEDCQLRPIAGDALP